MNYSNQPHSSGDKISAFIQTNSLDLLRDKSMLDEPITNEAQAELFSTSSFATSSVDVQQSLSSNVIFRSEHCEHEADLFVFVKKPTTGKTQLSTTEILAARPFKACKSVHTRRIVFG